MKITDIITEAANPAQQAAIAISMKKAGKKPKSEGVAEGDKKPHPKTWHDVDPKLGKQVDKMSQAEKVKKGLAHPDTLKKQGMAEGNLEEYGDTARGQKMLAKVHQRAADRVTSKQADKDPAYARKAQQTQDRAWDRLAVKEQGVADSGSDPLTRFKKLSGL